MKPTSRVALFCSGVVLVVGAGLAVTPFVEGAVSRVLNRANAVANHMPTPADTSMPAEAIGGLSGPLFLPGRDPTRMVPAMASGPNMTLSLAHPPDDNAPRFTVQDLNAIPGGEKFDPTDMNDRGEIVGNFRMDTTTRSVVREIDGKRVPKYIHVTARPAIYRDGRLEPLPGCPGCDWTFATGINNRGQVSGAARPIQEISLVKQNSAELPLPHLLRWTNGQLEDLTDAFFRIPGLENDIRSTRFLLERGDQVFIGADGSVYYGAGNLYRWQNGAVTRFDAGLVRRVNAHGVMVGLVPNPRPTGDVPSYVQSAMMPLNPPSLQPGIIDTVTGRVKGLGRYSDEPCAVNDSGEVMLRGYRSGSITTFSMLNNGKANQIATLPLCRGGFLNDNGWAVLGDGVFDAPGRPDLAGAAFGPFLWTRSGYYNLNDLLISRGEFALAQVIAVNNRDQILINAYRISDRQRHALLLTPTADKQGAPRRFASKN